jgi:hypothetical protein
MLVRVGAAICSAMIVFGCPSMALAESGVASVFVVRINDRGPFVPGRIIDLTPAAQALGFSGLAHVTTQTF